MIELIPNVSEGRRLPIVSGLADVLAGVPGVTLLDQTSDWSHNRSVFTLVGRGPALQAAAVALVDHAVREIDLRQHTGVHPRIGAVDVLPFVPLDGSTMGECVALARATGALLAARVGVPVYLYEEAALHPERRRLENIRRGQFEGLAAKMATPAWAPDFGSAAPHPTAGAIAVGARRPLVAFNVNLASDRLDVARAIATAVRERSGGLRGVKALGVPIAHRGLVQVSMNLTDLDQTTLGQAYARVCEEAGRRAVRVLESEIIGLVPRAAFGDATPADLRLVGFGPDRILEHRLASLGR